MPMMLLYAECARIAVNPVEGGESGHVTCNSKQNGAETGRPETPFHFVVTISIN